jgi:glycerol kinase
VAMAQKEHRQIFPSPGWVEHDVEEIWARTCEVIGEAMAKARVTGGDLAAVGITNQRETTVVWDRVTGKPFYNAIVWQDTRTAEICLQLAGGNLDRFRPVTGLPLATYFAGPKLLWILQNVPDARHAAEQGRALFGTIDSYLLWQLTGGAGKGIHRTDVTNASRTLLMNLQTLDWDPQLLAELKIPPQVLPKIIPSSGLAAGCVTDSRGPFGAAVPIAGILGDQHAAMVGQACFDVGESKNTYGTGCFMLLNTGPTPVASTHGLLTTVAYQFENQPPCYALEGSVAIAGSLVQWLRDNLNFITSSAEIESLAASVPDAGGLAFVPAFSGLFAPYWRSDARGVLVGLTGHSTKAHIARAALESTAHQTADVLEAMEKDSGVKLACLKVDGGMSRNNLLMQFQSDLLGVDVIRPQTPETTVLGAAYAAGLAVGYYKDQHTLRQTWRPDKTWRPAMPPEARQTHRTRWSKAIQKSLDWT